MWVFFGGFFLFFNFYKLDSHNETSVALANLRRRISKSWIENRRTSRDFGYDYQKRMFIDSFTNYIGPPNFVHYQIWSD